jgi:putative membrane protein
VLARQNAVVHPLAVAAALVAAAIHAWFFVLESLWFMRPAVFRRFGVGSEEQARAVRSFAYNQGFYNLFLAAGALGGVLKSLLGHPEAGVPVMLFACGSMLAAGVVLVTHNRAFARAAAIQAVPPLVAILAQVLLG